MKYDIKKHDSFMKLRKPIPKTGGKMKSGKEYRRNKEEDLLEIQEGINEYKEDVNEEKRSNL